MWDMLPETHGARDPEPSIRGPLTRAKWVHARKVAGPAPVTDAGPRKSQAGAATPTQPWISPDSPSSDHGCYGEIPCCNMLASVTENSIGRFAGRPGRRRPTGGAQVQVTGAPGRPGPAIRRPTPATAPKPTRTHATPAAGPVTAPRHVLPRRRRPVPGALRTRSHAPPPWPSS